MTTTTAFSWTGTPQIGPPDVPPNAKTTVSLIDPQGHEDGRVFPCFEHRTLSDLLHVAGVSWRYYGQEVGGIWMAPNAIKHICKAVNGQCTGKEFANNIEPKSSAILSDILTKCKLRGVSWVTPDGKNSDHSGNLARTGGPSWVASIVNAVGNSTCTDTINGNQVTYWDDTAILITWDDWGGWYDHVQPRIEPYPQGGYQMGFRVPLLVVSAYTLPGYIHNGREDFGSVARFVEHNFGIMEGELTFADERATATSGSSSPWATRRTRFSRSALRCRRNISLIRRRPATRLTTIEREIHSFFANKCMPAPSASAPTADDDHKGIFAAENLAHPVSAGHHHVSGCIAPPGTTVALINPQGVEFTRVYPCFKHRTLSDLLHVAGVTWRY